MRYQILESYDNEILENKINKAIKKGAYLHGHLNVTQITNSILYSQAVIYNEPQDDLNISIGEKWLVKFSDYKSKVLFEVIIKDVHDMEDYVSVQVLSDFKYSQFRQNKEYTLPLSSVEFVKQHNKN